MTLKPADGTAVILHLIEAARAVGQSYHFPHDPAAIEDVRILVDRIEMLETYLAEQIPDEQLVGWEPRTWGEVVAGDTINAGSGDLLVQQAARLDWHVEPDRRVWHVGRDAVDEERKPEYCRGCKGRCHRAKGFQNFPLEHSQMAVTLAAADGREGRFTMPTDGEIEVLRGEAGREIDRAAGRGAQIVKADRDMVLTSWAGEAFQTLAAAGLSPEPQIMTMEEGV